MSDFGSMQQRIAELERENAALKAERDRLSEWGPGLYRVEPAADAPLFKPVEEPPKARRKK